MCVANSMPELHTGSSVIADRRKLPGSAHQDVRTTADGYVVDLRVDNLWAESASYPLVLDPAVAWTDQSWYDNAGLAVAFAPVGSEACEGGPCPLADPVDGRVAIGNPEWDDPDMGLYNAYVGADLSALAGRQVASAVLGSWEYHTLPQVTSLCSRIGANSTGADLLEARCGQPVRSALSDPQAQGWRADVTAGARKAVRGTAATGRIAGFAIDSPGRDISQGSWSSGDAIEAPWLRLVYAGYPVPRPLTKAQTFGCACWAGGSTGNQALAADPVNTATGALMENFTDLSLAGPALPLNLTRTYNSLDGTSVGFGPGWMSGYSARLVEEETGEIVFTDPSGTQSRFGVLPGGGYAAIDAAVTARLEDGPSSTRILRNLSGETMTFDATGALVAQTDERGQGLSLTYVDGRLSTVTDVVGQALSYTWDGTGASARVTSVTSSDGRTVAYGYSDVAGARRLTSVTDVTGATTTYQYTGRGWLTRITDPLGNVSARNVYDSAGRVTSQRDETGALTTFTWDAATQTAVVTDPTGRTRTDVYVGLNLVRQIDGDGAVTEKLYDANNNPAASVDAADRLYRDDFDDRNRLVRRVTSAPLHTVESWTYDDADRITSHTDADGNVTGYAYDSDGQLVAVTSADGGETTFTYTTGDDGVPAHLLASTTDPLGRTTTYTYDAAGNRLTTTSPGGATSTATYDASHRVVTSTTPGGATTSYTYDAAGRPLTVTDPSGAVTTHEYDAGGRLIRSTDALGRATRFWYDRADRLVRTRDAAGREALTTYDGAGRVATTTDALGAVTTYTYDDAGRLVATTDPLGRVTSSTYDEVGNVTAVTDAAGATTRYTYDVLGRVVSTTDPDGITSTTTYDRRGNAVEVRDGAGNVAYTWFDVMNRPAAVADADGVMTGYRYDLAGQLVAQWQSRTSWDEDIPGYWEDSTTYAYDADGRRTATVEARGNVPVNDPASYTTAVEYDADGRPVAVTDPLGRVARTRYDAAGRPVAATDAAGAVTTTTYNAVGWPTAVTSPDGSRTRYAYDQVGNVVRRVDPLGRTTAFAYDAGGRLVSQTDPLGRVTQMTYDAVGNMTRLVKPSGTATADDPDDGTVTYTYDDVRRMTGRSFSDGTAAFAYTYSAAGRLETASRVAGDDVTASTTYERDDLGRTTSVVRTGAGAVAAAYTYTGAGRLSGAAWSGGQSVAYWYDRAGRVVEAAPEGPGGLTSVGYRYDAAGHLTSTQRAGATPTVTSVGYDVAGQVTSLAHTAGSATLAGYDISRDVRGNPSVVTAQVAGVSTRTAYEYDLVGRVTAECRPAAGAGCSTSVPGSWFTYDRMGNRRTETVRTASGSGVRSVRTVSTYDAADQLVSQSVGTAQVASFGWSADGSLVSSTSAAGERSWVSDLSGELASVVLEDGRVVGFEHDADGNRVARSVDGVRDVSWSWDSTVGALPVRVGEATSAGGAVAWLPDVLSGTGSPLAQVSGGAGSWLLSDPFSSVVAAVSPGAGVVSGSARFDAFGVAAVPASGVLAGAPVGFAGQYLDGLVGAYDLRARDYVPGLGRFTAPDPVAVPTGMGMVNGYGYAFGNPLAMQDVSGMWPTCEDLSGLCDSPEFLWNEMVGFGQGIGATADALVHPLRTHQQMVDACNAGFDQWSGGTGMTWEGGAQCIDNLNPIAQIGRDFSASVSTGCVSESGQAFGRGLFGAAATVAPFAKMPTARGKSPVAGGTVRTPSVLQVGDVKLPAVPKGATGRAVQSGKGLEYAIDRGTPELDHRVSSIRIMDPVTTGKYQYPRGYAVYMNQAGQTINPLTGQTIPSSHPFAHIPLP